MRATRDGDRNADWDNGGESRIRHCGETFEYTKLYPEMAATP